MPQVAASALDITTLLALASASHPMLVVRSVLESASAGDEPLTLISVVVVL